VSAEPTLCGLTRSICRRIRYGGSRESRRVSPCPLTPSGTGANARPIRSTQQRALWALVGGWSPITKRVRGPFRASSRLRRARSTTLEATKTVCGSALAKAEHLEQISRSIRESRSPRQISVAAFAAELLSYPSFSSINSTGTGLTVNWTALDADSDGYRDSARETASAASVAGVKSLSGRFGNGTNPKLR